MVDYVDEVMLVIHQHESARISTGAGAVERLEKIFAIKEAYHHLLTSEEIRDLKHRECIALFRAAIEEKGRRKAAAYLLQAFKHRFWRTRNFLEIAVWILGFPRSKAIKRIWKGFIDEVSFFGRFFIRL